MTTEIKPENVSRKTLVVAVDFDGVTAATCVEVGRILNDPITYAQIETWNWVTDRWGSGQFYDSLFPAHSSPTLEPMPGAVEAIKKLQETCLVFILTANPAKHVGPICQWLLNHGLMVPVMAVKDSDDKMKTYWDVLVDDAPMRHDGPTGDGREVIIYRAPYNNGKSRRPYVESEAASEWDEIVQRVLALAKEKENHA